MKYRLCEPYRLEGWKGQPTGIYHSVKADTAFIPFDRYRFLLHMNGVEDIQEDQLNLTDRNFLHQLLEWKVIRPCISDEPLSEEQKYHYYDRSYIAYVHWAITGKCNYRCKHCYMYSPLARFPEPSFEECCRIIQSMQDAGVRSLALTGGEPLVRTDFLKIVQEIADHGIRVDSIYTNGALVTDQLLDELERLGQKPRFHISFDGLEYHDWLRGIPGAKDSALRAIACCRKHGNSIYAAMCVHRKNRDEMLSTVKFLSSCGVSRIRIKFMLPNGMWAENHSEESVNMEEAVDAVTEFINDFFAEGMPADVIIDNMFQYNRASKLCTIPYVKKCNQGALLCKKTAVTPFIGPTGVVLPCMTLGGCSFQDRFPNVLKTPLAQIMSDSYYHEVTHVKKSEFFSMHEECHTCSERAICTTGCRACVSGEYLDLDPWNCTFLRGGHYRKIDEVIWRSIQTYHLEDEVKYQCFTK